MENSSRHTVWYWKGADIRAKDVQHLSKKPLSIREQGKSYAVVMRTPGDEIPHVAGFCLAEGIAGSPGDFATLGICR